jgi:hypothetical protein
MTEVKRSGVRTSLISATKTYKLQDFRLSVLLYDNVKTKHLNYIMFFKKTWLIDRKISEKMLQKKFFCHIIQIEMLKF